VYHHHPPPVGVTKISKSGQCFYIYGSYVVASGLLFLSGEGGPDPLHNVQLPVLRILTDNPTVHFTISSPVVFLDSLPDVSSFLRCTCFFKFYSIPLLPSSFARHLSPNVHPFRVPCTTFSLIFFCHLCSTISPLWPPTLLHAGMTWRIMSLQAAANFWGPHCPGSVPSAFHDIFWVDANPRAASSVLLTGCTSASSLGTSSYTTMDSVSSGVASIFSG
jgi:hypothetical protein